MAAKEEIWNICVDDIPYKIEFRKNTISVNNGEPIKINKLKKESGMLETKYLLPIQEKEVALHINQSSKRVLTVDGRVWNTGEEYVPANMPAWGWVFIVLYAINFFALVGGAIGGALSAGFAVISASIAANRKMKTVVRVICCLGIWIGITIFEILLVMMIYGL